MTSNVQSRQENAPAGKRIADSAPAVVVILINLMLWLLLALVISILVEWIGMIVWWPEQGSNHSLNMLHHEVEYLSGDMRHTLMVSDTVAYVRKFSDTFYRWIWQTSGLEDVVLWLAAPPAPDAAFWVRDLHAGYSAVSQFVLAAANITQVFAARIAVLTLSMPAFLLVILISVLDGLVRRDLRRWGGGRESAFIYHRAKPWISRLFIATWVVYLSLPWSVHPAFSIVPFAAAIGIVTTITVGTFKKYL